MPDPSPDQPGEQSGSAASRGGSRSSRQPRTAAAPDESDLTQDPDDAGPAELARARAAELERLRGTLKRKFH